MESHALSKPEYRSGWQWWLGAIVAIAAFAFGAFGLWQYESSPEHGGHADALSVFYHTLQLFILHAPHLEPPLPWQLHLGRWLAAALLFAAAGKAFFKVFRNELMLLRLWSWQRKHVVVCGLGDLGLRLALDGRNRKRFVVAIEKQSAPAALEKARAGGVLVLEGDARDPDLLRRARLERADLLIAACNDDQTNVAIASFAGQYARANKKRNSPLTCRLLIQDSKLRAMLHESFFPHTGPHYRVNFSDLDLQDTAARQVLRKHSLDFLDIRQDQETEVHLVVIGFGQMGQSLALHAARTGHFANEVGKHSKRLRITVVDRDPADGWNEFALRYENLNEVCDAEFVALGPAEERFISAIKAYCASAKSREALVTYAFCLESGDGPDDQTNLRLGLELSKRVRGLPAQVLIHQTSRLGFAALFSEQGRGPALGERVHAFGLQEDVFAWDVLLHESEDELARVFAEDYRVERKKEGAKDEDNPPWDGLSEDFKDSNRQAADHVAAKLRALGLRDAPVIDGVEPVSEFKPDELLLLAKMEHARWCAERWLSGWTPGPVRDPKKKISDSLVPWNQLPPGKQKIDREQIAAIPKALSQIKRGAYPAQTTKGRD